MRKVTLSLLAGVLLFALSCGGGDPTTPEVDNLAGLEGTWDVNIVYSGQLSGTGGNVPVNEVIQTFWIIGTNSVVGESGQPLVWSYNGTTLTISIATTVYNWDPICGNMTLSGNLNFVIPVKPGETIANITGPVNLTLTSQFCGESSGTCPSTGNLTKR